MSYAFPPPTSLAWTIAFIALLVALLVSIVACGIRPPKSNCIWGLAVVFWLTCIPVLLFLSGPIDLRWDMLMLIRKGIISLSLGAAVGGYLELFRDQRVTRNYYGSKAHCLTFIGLLVLTFVLLEPIGHPREASNRSTCKNNLKNIGLAFHNYHDTHNRFPLNVGQTPARSWRIDLLPYMDQADNYKAYDQAQAWDSAHNSPLAKVKIPAYQCPSVPAGELRDASHRLFTAYALLTGPRTASDWIKKHNLNLPDGTSNTVFVAEACGQQIVWSEPRDVVASPETVGVNLPGAKPHQSAGVWSSYHKNGAHTLYVDGSVRFVDANVDSKVLSALATADGHEAPELP